MGGIPMAPAGPVRAHVMDLIHQGMTQAAIIRQADVTSPYLSALLYGEPKRGKAPVATMNARRAGRLLAVRYEPPQPTAEPAPTSCPSSEAFEPVGYRCGRCPTCGQVAPVQTRGGRAVLYSHPHPVPDAQEAGALPLAAGRHPDCGTPRGHNRHMREKTTACEPCKAAKNGYDQGRSSALSAVHRAQQTAVPWSLVDEMEAAAHAMVFRRPYPQLRELNVRVLRAVAAARESRGELERVMAA